MVKIIKIATLFIALAGFAMYYLGYGKVFDFISRHYFLWDKLCWFLFSYIIWFTSNGFARYAYAALSAFLALRVYWGIAEEIDAARANSDFSLMPVYAMLIIITFGILTAIAEWIQHRRKVW